jgi:hypothetical protein
VWDEGRLFGPYVIRAVGEEDEEEDEAVAETELSCIVIIVGGLVNTMSCKRTFRNLHAGKRKHICIHVEMLKGREYGFANIIIPFLFSCRQRQAPLEEALLTRPVSFVLQALSQSFPT